MLNGNDAMASVPAPETIVSSSQPGRGAATTAGEALPPWLSVDLADLGSVNAEVQINAMGVGDMDGALAVF